jgi:hypothetical protein
MAFLFASIFGISAMASVELGVGSTSATGGRLVPSLAAGLATTDWGLFASSTGVANSYYYQSNYQLSFYWMYSQKTLWGGDISPGFGIGSMYTVRSFKDVGATSELKSDDFLLGPALRMHWIYFNTIYLGFDAIWGLRSLANVVGLSYQDYTCVSFGVSL